MFTLSEEQQTILNEIRDGSNVMVDAVAGTGKTTLILSIARELSDLRILQLTYNASLRKDVKETIEQNELTNITVHTYHSLAKRYYLSTGYTDTEIRRLLFKELPPKEVISDIDLLVLDECQDMTLLYFHLMVKFLKDYNKPVQLLILGDYMQGLYEFKGADIRFLTLSDIIWSDFCLLRTPTFKKCTMKMSFRITNQMRSFVNNVMLGEDRMDACRDGDVVTYIRNSRYNMSKVVVAEVNKLMEQGVKPCEIFILGNSVKGTNSNIRYLENTLVEKDIPCHVPMLENEKMDDRVIDGKIVFSTFHSVKGRQRKYVFIVGFDNSYLKYYARGLPRDVCPNTLYVAATRATQGLYLLETSGYSSNRPLEFLKMNHIQMKQCDYIAFRGNHQSIFQDDDENDELYNNVIKKHVITPTELVRFISETVIENISPIIDRIFVKENENMDTLDIPTVIETKRGFYEEVSDLNGIAIPCMYYDYLKEIWFSKNKEENLDIIQETDTDTENIEQEENLDINQETDTDTENIEQEENLDIIQETDTDTENIEQEENLDIIQEDQNVDEPAGNVLLDIINNSIQNMRSNEHIYLKQIVNELPAQIETIEDYLYIANVSVAVQEMLYFKLKQIDRDEYKWLTEEMVIACKHRLRTVIGPDCKNEMPHVEDTIIHATSDEQHTKIDEYLTTIFGTSRQFRFTGRVDLITETTVWELKCTSEITIEHLVQVIAYAWLWNMRTYDDEEPEPKVFKIFNIKTGDILRLDATMDELNHIMSELLLGKYQEIDPKTDEEFIADCHTILK